MPLLNKPTDPAQKKAIAQQIIQVCEDITVPVIAVRGMLDVEGFDEKGICRSSEGYYEELASALVTWINSVPADQAAHILATLVLPDIEMMPHHRAQHLKDPEGIKAIRSWRRSNLQ